jgi:hypothetical protein
MSETATNDNGLQFLPIRMADEDQQKALYHLMDLVTGGHFRCNNCGDSDCDFIFPDSSGTIGEWLSDKNTTLIEGQRGYSPDDWGPNSGYMLVAPSRTASREVQQAAAELIQDARSAEMACPTCGEAMHLDYVPEETHAVLVINEWLGRQYGGHAAAA